MVLSTLVARDALVSLARVGTFVCEGLLIYVLILNAVRSPRVLRASIWALMAAAAFLGSLAIYQEATRKFDGQFGGLMQHKFEDKSSDESDTEGPRPLVYSREKVAHSERAAGPMGDPNFFAQVLIMLLPLALLRVRHERGAVPKLLAGLLSILLFCGILLTYSRGGALTVVLLIALLVGWRYLRLRHLVLAGLGAALLVQFVSPGYLMRVDSIAKVRSLSERIKPVDVDPATTGRLTEMLAAMNVFLDHPWIGVGPAQFTPFYSMEYMADPSVSFKHIFVPREAHSLYLETLAEEGLIGFVVFMSIIAFTGLRLWQQRRRWLGVDVELADTATAFVLSLVAFLGTSVFLHLAYQRYFFLFLGLAGACVQISLYEAAAREAGVDAKELEIRSRGRRAGVRRAGPTRHEPGCAASCCAS
jgi:hypothetical protein